MAAQKSSDAVRVGIVGAGIGQAHVRGYKQVPAADVVAVCDINTERARKVAQEAELHNAQIFADYREMLDKAGLDAVSVCVPNALHCPITIDCLDAGTHVICEKPLALNAAEGQEIAEAATRNNRKCMVAQVLRFRADSLFLKQCVLDGELGEIYYAHTGWLRKRGIPNYGGWFTTQSMSGGGPLIDIGVHLLDIAWWLCGCPKPVTVSGMTHAAFGPRGQGIGNLSRANLEGTFDVEDLAVAIIRFENGLTINLEVSWALHHRSDRQWCQIFGDEGGCDWGNHPALYRDIHGTPTTITPEIPKSDMWQGEMQHFIDCILNDTTPDPDVTQGIQMMKMLDGIYKSAETGREATIS